jgi:hypothetical protein
MSAIHRIRLWFSRLVHKPADLFDIASGFATALFVVLAAWNHADPQVSPSMSFIGDKAPWWLWFTVIGLAAACQPVALHLDDPDDPRHPLLQPAKWLRFILAGTIGCWFFILYWSMWLKLGPHHVEALYLMMVGMNAYIVAHVLFRARD